MEGEGANGSDFLLQGEALIRSNLGVDTRGLDELQWARLYAQAIWLEQWRLRNQAEMLAALFGGK